jgi:cell pole-organizing protein PopZ
VGSPSKTVLSAPSKSAILLIRRIAERREAERQRMEDEASKEAAAIERKAEEFAEQVRRELAGRRSVPAPAPTPAPEPVSTPDLDAMSMEEYAAHRNSGQPTSKPLGTGKYWTEGGLKRDSKPE